MYTTFRGVVTLPLFDDDEKTRVAKLLQVLLLASLLGAMGYGIYQSLVATGEYGSTALLVELVVSVLGISISWFLMRQGRIRSAGMIYTLLVWLILSYRSVESGGETAFEFVLVPLIAGALLGASTVLLAGVVSMVTGLGLLLAGAESPAGTRAMSLWISQAVVLLVATVLIYLSGRSQAKALQHARRKESELETAHRRLQDQNRGERKQYEQLSSVLQREVTLESALDPQEVLDAACREVVGLLDVTSAYVCGWDGKRLVATVLAEYFGVEASAAEKVSDLGQEYEQYEDIDTWLNTERPTILRLGDPDLRSDELEEMLTFGVKSILRIPMMARGRILGYFEIYESREERDFTETEVLVACNLASQAGIALDNARLLNTIGETVREVSAAAAEILASTTQQVSSASEQSAAITQTTTTVDEVRTIAEQTALRAQEVTEGAQSSVEISQRGQNAVQENVKNMSLIRTRVEGIAENILALAEQMQQIGQITATVKAIASQSNMLALNASVEAARAGEQGKGFAVVASEVRSLADQSHRATQEIEGILSDIQMATNATVMATEEGSKGVEEGVQLSAQTGKVIQELGGTLRRSAQAAAQMLAGGQQQSSGIEQIALAMSNINQAATQSMASTRQTERAAQDLNALALRLQSIVDQHEL